MPPIPAEAAPTPPCPLMTNFLVSRLSFFVRRLSSVIRRLSSIVLLFVPLRFAIIFYSKIFSIEPTHGEHHLPLTGEQWAKLEPLIPQPKSAATRVRPPIDERLVLDKLITPIELTRCTRFIHTNWFFRLISPHEQS